MKYGGLLCYALCGNLREPEELQNTKSRLEDRTLEHMHPATWRFEILSGGATSQSLVRICFKTQPGIL